ncbi:PspC domain-containing protein [Flagellimonas halotolerans]|uniref:PspC domain-containing protein n=1 Tax=Flagellimonas halotolerans TaxID=3112164 RepID=A0ABU6IRV8_9FLAO|nr:MULTISPECIES: PspC domain-containing protein [unclassified Allomuricauda]MEC3965909.1 PspC domain-containing protein [Muricauda sp. SYSU M86414]MEC4265625.1 PspC domain-containing protein [Muricauda sp. SYSU M84420]
MNKTVNINLANTLFHIDDDAYNKLRRYLESIKRSFSGTKGSDEIIADIEARIAELFLEKMENERQVITHKEVDQVIDVMGQPEDYMVDEDIFEDEPKKAYTESTGKGKKLYRDIDHKYIGGVCAGLEHYLGIDALWVRLIFILLAVFTSGFGLIAYILLWILVPEAATTSQKLDMRGEPVNISNIERKVKEGFDDVAEKVKSVDYDKVGNKVKSSSKTFFDTIGDIILFLFKVFGKFIGILLIIIGASTLVGLFFGLFTVGMFDAVHVPGIDFYEIVNTSGAPVWVVSILLFFAVGIPFFFLLYLGLKILVNNLKSIGNIAKFSLLGLWLISVGLLIVFGIRQAAEFSYTGSVNDRTEPALGIPSDTLIITMKDAYMEYDRDDIHFGRMTFGYDENDNRVLMSDEVDIKIRKSDTDSIKINIRKDADGSSTLAARDRARNIEYGYEIDGNEILLDEYLITPTSNKARNQEVTITIYIPASITVYFDDSTSRYIGRGIDNDQGYYRSGIAGQHWLMDEDGELQCLDCTDLDDDSNENGKIIINEDGIDIDIKDNQDSFEMKINEDGVKVKAKN